MRRILLFVLSAGVLPFAETHIPGGNISGVWTADGSPYYIDGEVHIPTDSMLVIEPGCSIIFTGHYKFCVDSNAVLKAIGTESDSIVFTTEDTVTEHRWRGIYFIHASDECVLRYCVIENGYSSLSDDTSLVENYGGGIFCRYSDISVMNCSIRGNRARWGAGIYCSHSDLFICCNTFLGNFADHGGGGIYSDSSSPKIENNFFRSNWTNSGGYITGGGGILCKYSAPSIINNSISNNVAHYSAGGGICCYACSSASIYGNMIANNSAMSYGDGGGGGIFCAYSKVSIGNNLITNNYATWDGGAGISCVYNSECVIFNNIIYDNTTTGIGASGGGILCDIRSKAIVINNTITANSAGSGGGILGGNYSKVISIGNIMWENWGYFDFLREIVISGDGCTSFVAFSDVDSSECGHDDIFYISGTIIWGPGNINADPLFVDTLYHLSLYSPCVDVGPGSLYIPLWDTTIYLPHYDFEEHPRPWGVGWDMGAHEYVEPLAVKNSEEILPQNIQISAYPNPFNSSCLITAPAGARVEIYDLRGRLVYTSPHPLTPSPQGEGEPYYPLPPGEGGLPKASRVRANKFTWSPDQSVPSGVYLIRAMTEDGQVAQKKVVLIR